MKTKKPKTIWMSRDLKGEDKNLICFWNKKPSWNNQRNDYDIESGEILSLNSECSDLTHVLETIGLMGGIIPGQLVKLTTTIEITQGKTTAEKAQELSKRMKSKKKPTQKEVIAFLTELGEKIEDDEEDKDEDEDGWVQI